jgi:hypothetical protein
MDVFTALALSDYLKTVLLVDNVEQFGQPILIKTSIKENISQIETLSGKAKRDTQNIALELVKDMQAATHYPPIIKAVSDAIELTAAINYLITNISLKEQDAGGSK